MTHPPPPRQGVAWSPDGAAFVLAFHGSPLLQCFAITDVPPRAACVPARAPLDVGEDLRCVAPRWCGAVGVGEIAWDATGERFAVSFVPRAGGRDGDDGGAAAGGGDVTPAARGRRQPPAAGSGIGSGGCAPERGEEDPTAWIAVYAVTVHPHLDLVLRGVIRPPRGAGAPGALAFQPRFEQGALLAAALAGGAVHTWPMLFAPAAASGVRGRGRK